MRCAQRGVSTDRLWNHVCYLHFESDIRHGSASKAMPRAICIAVVAQGHAERKRYRRDRSEMSRRRATRTLLHLRRDMRQGHAQRFQFHELIRVSVLQFERRWLPCCMRKKVTAAQETPKWSTCGSEFGRIVGQCVPRVRLKKISGNTWENNARMRKRGIGEHVRETEHEEEKE